MSTLSVSTLLTGQGSDRMHHCQEPIEWEEEKGVDRGVGRDVGEVLHRLAPDTPEGPRRQDVVGGGEGDAEDDEEQVRHRQAARETWHNTRTWKLARLTPSPKLKLSEMSVRERERERCAVVKAKTQ